MEHVGIDLGSRESQVRVRSERGEILEECRCRTRRWCTATRSSALGPGVPLAFRTPSRG